MPWFSGAYTGGVTVGRYHDEIAADLAQSIGPTPFLGVPLGSVFLGQLRDYESPGLADVITIKPSYRHFCLSIYEVKVSRSDFLGDLRREKWRRYLPHCHRFYFATLPNVAKKDDIPQEAGWVVKGPKSWAYRKAASAREVDIPEFTLLSLLFSKEREPRLRSLKNLQDAKYDIEYHNRFEKIARILGKDVAKAYADRLAVKDKIYELDSQISEMNQYLEQMREVIQDGLGIPKKKYFYLWDIKKRLEELKAEALKVIGKEGA
jgi:hypothetical protein